MPHSTPVVIIHGMWSTPDTLREISDKFVQQGYAVHTPRLDHHYARKHMTKAHQQALARTSINDYVDSVANTLGALHQPAIVVGHSMGGLIAQLVAARIQVAKLILISSAPAAGINAWSLSTMRTLGHNLLTFPLWRRTTHLLLKNIEYGIANTQTPQIRREIIRHATFESGRAATEIGLWFLFKKPPTRVNYQAIDCPVLILGGTKDKITPLAFQKKTLNGLVQQPALRQLRGRVIGPSEAAIYLVWLSTSLHG